MVPVLKFLKYSTQRDKLDTFGYGGGGGDNLKIKFIPLKIFRQITIFYFILNSRKKKRPEGKDNKKEGYDEMLLKDQDEYLNIFLNLWTIK